MANSKMIKFKELNNDQELQFSDLSKILGGIEEDREVDTSLENGCDSGVCENGREVGARFCEGGAVCTSGIGVCTNQT